MKMVASYPGSHRGAKLFFASERIKAIILTVMDQEPHDEIADCLVSALATDAVIADLRRLAPAKPRKPRVVKEAKAKAA